MSKTFIELKVTISEEVYKKLEEIADIDDCSVKELVKRMLESYTSIN